MISKQRSISSKTKDKIFVWSIILPSLFFFMIFIYYPFFRNVYLSFMDYNYIKDPVFSGSKNLKKLFSDKYFFNALKNTLIITIISVPVILSTSLILSVAIFQMGKIKNLFRGAIFSTYLVPLVVASVIFKLLFGTEAGLMNSLLNSIGIENISWLTQPKLAMFCIILLNVWNGTGYYMVIFLAGLSSIDHQLYEAAVIDGAGSLRKFFDITIPSLKPTLVFAVIFATITFLRTFVTVEIITGGGPYRSTETIIKYMFDQGFKSRNVGYSSLLAIVVFIITLIVSLIQMKLTKSQED